MLPYFISVGTTVVVMAADSAAARREARRRRILENSENRLHKITGRYENASESTTCNTKHPHSTECENSWNCKGQKRLINGIIRPEIVEKNSQDSFESAGSKYADEILRRVQNQNNPFRRFEEPSEGESDDDILVTGNETKSITSKLQFFVCDLHFIYLAVIVRTLLEFRIANLFFEPIFLPFLVLLIPREIFLLREGNSNVCKLIAGALMLMGLPKFLVESFTNFIMVTSDVIGVLAVYLVAFTFTDCAIVSVKS